VEHHGGLSRLPGWLLFNSHRGHKQQYLHLMSFWYIFRHAWLIESIKLPGLPCWDVLDHIRSIDQRNMQSMLTRPVFINWTKRVLLLSVWNIWDTRSNRSLEHRLGMSKLPRWDVQLFDRLLRLDILHRVPAGNVFICDWRFQSVDVPLMPGRHRILNTRRLVKHNV